MGTGKISHEITGTFHSIPILGSFVLLSKSINPLEFTNKAACVSGLVQDASPRILLESLRLFAAGWAKNKKSLVHTNWKMEGRVVSCISRTM